MQIFLLWRTKNQAAQPLEPRTVEANLQRLFSPLFQAAPPESRLLTNRAMSAAILTKPIEGWLPPLFEQAGAAWAFAMQYPVTAHAVLERQGIPVESGNVLLALAGALRENPEPLLRALAPMFALAWSHSETEAFIQNDGLGLAQLFEYEDDRVWAVANKLSAFRALGAALEPVPEEWAVRMTMDWFPLLMTGYKNVRFLPPATRLRITPQGVERSSHDVLAQWLAPRNLTPDECLELAYTGFQDHIRAVMPLWSKALAGLTGGRDSRAIASGLIRERAQNVKFSVRGRAHNLDVQIATQLAESAKLPFQVRRRAMQPPETPEGLRRSLALALLWQGGYIDIRQHATFLNNNGDLDGGIVNLMGQHGEIGRGYYAERIGAANLTPAQFEPAMVDYFTYQNTPGHRLLRRDRFDFVRETIAQSYRQADLYNLQGLDRLDFFYLYERTRRWASAGNHIQPGIIVTPFLNPEYITAVYNYPAAERGTQPFHKFIVRRNRRDWTKIPYEKEMKLKKQREERRAAIRKSRLKYYFAQTKLWLREYGLDHFPALVPVAPHGLWAQAGLPLAESALCEGGFWTEVFDADIVRRRWPLAPEQFVLTALLPSVLADGVAD